MFEFLLDKADAQKWMAVLPPHLYGQTASAQPASAQAV
jgi:hypothetical protein